MWYHVKNLFRAVSFLVFFFFFFLFLFFVRLLWLWELGCELLGIFGNVFWRLTRPSGVNSAMLSLHGLRMNA